MSRFCKLCVALFALNVGLLAAAPAPKAPTREQIAQWVQQLGDNDFTVREEATKKLWEAGAPAEADLLKAAKSDDVEVSRRAKDILEKFKWGIYPDTPAKVVELIQQYQNAGPGNRGPVVRALFELGAPGCRVLLKIAQREEDAGARRELVGQLGAEMGRALPKMLMDGNYESLEPLLELGIAGEVKPGIAAYTAFWTLRGKLEERIAHHQALAQREGQAKVQAEVLAYLHRARGDLAAARAAADRSERPDLIESILYESGDWNQLARRPTLADAEQPVEKLGYRAAYHRLAGNVKESEEALAELKKFGDNLAGNDREDPTLFATAKALFINDRPADALALLEKGANRLRVVEVLCAQMKFREAQQVVDKARTLSSDELPVLELTLARHLHGLGEKDKAKAIFERYAKQIQTGKDAAWYENLIESEARSGLREAAFEHATRALAASNDAGLPRKLFGKLFPEKKAESAEGWWSFLRKRNATRAPAEIMKDVRALLDGKLAAADVTDRVNTWVESLERRLHANRAAVPVNEIDKAANAIADAAEAAGLEGLAVESLTKLDTSGALIRIGDLLAKKKKWAEAAERYRQAWEKDRTQPLPLFLHGHALAQLGRKELGQKLMDQSHWLPLGGNEADAGRLAFATELGQRGHTDAYKKENELLLRLSQPASYYWGEALRRTTGDAAAKKDYVRSADGHERAMLRVLRTYVSFVYAGAYVAVPALVHRHKAIGLALAGKIDDARREADLALAALPGEVELAIQMVPLLEKAGKKREADELFVRALGIYENLCKDYPRCSWAHNSAAWLSACCRRNLDRALEHAKKAVELAPESPGHLDTLAEVYFQRGDKDQAIATQKRVVAMDPKKPYFKKQLKRIEAGDRTAERPAEEDDD